MGTDSREAFVAGLKAIAPMLPGVVPFGLTAGVAAVDAGLSPAAALGSSVLIFAGVSQLATMQLIDRGALPVVIVLTAWVINLRFAMYSASLAPYFAKLPPRWSWPLSYLMTGATPSPSCEPTGSRTEPTSTGSILAERWSCG